MTFLGWIEAHPGLASWVQGVGTAAAAGIAFWAAYLAFAGAKLQAAVTERVSADAMANEKRALAAALWSELNDCRMRLHGMIGQLRTTKVRDRIMLPLHELHFEIYMANLAIVGKLPSDTAWTVVQTYKVLLDHGATISDLRRGPNGKCADSYPSALATRFEQSIHAIDLTLSRLAEIAVFKTELVQIAREVRSGEDDGARSDG